MPQKTAAALLFAAALALRLGAEHPTEHPAEHPVEKKGHGQACTMEDVAGAAEKWAGSSGTLKLRDKVEKKDLELTFVKVHRERLSKVGKDRYFVCADFRAADGTVYDVDLFMKGKDKDQLKADGKPMLHKVNGEPRYDWVEKKGVWKTVARKKEGAKKK